MDYSLEKSIAQYTKEAFQMARKGQLPINEAESVPVPEPMPVPKSSTRLSEVSHSNKETVPETELEFAFADIVLDDIVQKEENKSSSGEDIAQSAVNSAINTCAKDACVEEKVEMKSDTGDMHPSFEDYISRRNRSWERGTNPKTSAPEASAAKKSAPVEETTVSKETKTSEMSKEEE